MAVDSETRAKKIIQYGFIGIFANVILVIFKGLVGFLSGSIAIILDAVNNLTDVLSSVVTIVGTRLANRRPDRKHPYGHGRMEYLATIVVTIVILLAGLLALKESVEKIINPGGVSYTPVTFIIVITAIIVKILLGTSIKRAGEKYQSSALKAAGKDALMDAVLSTATLIAGILNIAFNLQTEGLFGALISIFIIKTSIDMMYDAGSVALGSRTDAELVQQVRDLLNQDKEVHGVFDLSLHDYGPTNIVGTAHIEVRDDMTAREIHQLTRKLSTLVFKKLGIVITIGIYATNRSGKSGEIYKKVLETTQKYPEILEVHGFYVDETARKVYFDLVFDFSASDDTQKILKNVTKTLERAYPKYRFLPIFDADISVS